MKLREQSIICMLLVWLLVVFAGCGDISTQKEELPENSSRSNTSSGETSSALNSAIGFSSAVPADVPAGEEEIKLEKRIDDLLSSQTLEEKIAQLFIIKLGSNRKYYSQVSEEMQAYVTASQPGGYILFAYNITTRQETKTLIEEVKRLSTVAPFICIDEEGGEISRLTGRLEGYEKKPAAAEIGAAGDTDYAHQIGDTIGETLQSVGVNLNFAPVADVLTNPDNSVIGSRAFGSDPVLVADMAAAFQRGLHENQIITAPKHFPGHGGTEGDSHEGSVVIHADAARLQQVEYIPFKRVIDEGAQCILTGHIKAPAADSSGLPASLSPYFVTDVLRNELGFNGVVITDGMDMGAITDLYSPEEAAKLAIGAGTDIVLLPEDFERAKNGLVEAVQSGAISEARINESVRRIYRLKLEAGLIQ